MPVYAAVEDLQDRMGIPLDDDRQATLIQCVEAASRWIEGETNRRFYTVSETRYYSLGDPHSHLGYYGGRYYDAPWMLERPWGSNERVMLDDVLSVTQVATDEDGDGVYERVWTVGTDYWLGPRNALADGKPYRTLNRNPLVGRYIFPVWDGAVSVTGAFGYSATTPTPIRELCLQVAELMARPILSSSMPGVLTYKLADELTVTMAGTALPESGKSILANYTEFAGVL